MFFGVLVHGATLDYRPDLLFEGVRTVSDHFRMATFFVISGYFTALVCQRLPAGAYVRNRALLLLVPLVSALLLVNPLANWLIHNWHNQPMSLAAYLLDGGWRRPALGNGVWHLQMWFLFALVFYALLAPLVVRAAQQALWLRLMDRWSGLSPAMRLWAVALAMGALILLCRGLHDALLYKLFAGTRLAWVFNATMNYLPWTLLGALAFMDRRLFGALHGPALAGLVLAGLAYAAVLLGADHLPRTAERIAFWMTRTAFTLFLVAVLLKLFAHVFTRPSRALGFAVDSAFSFYIFHFLVIYALANLLAGRVAQVHMMYAIILVAAPPLTLALHGLVIARVPQLRLMFNGKAMTHRAAAPAVS